MSRRAGNLRVAKDFVPGKHGLAGEYAGNREKDNPFEWDAEWQDMVRRSAPPLLTNFLIHLT